MREVSLFLAILLVALALTPANSSELTFSFGNPSFSGNGKSSHYLTIENIEKTRKDAIKAEKKAAADKLEANGITECKIENIRKKMEEVKNKPNQERVKYGQGFAAYTPK